MNFLATKITPGVIQRLESKLATTAEFNFLQYSIKTQIKLCESKHASEGVMNKESRKFLSR